MDGDGRKERADARAALREKRRRSGRVGVAQRVEGEGRGLPSPPDMGHSAIDVDIESLYRRSPSDDLPYVTSRSLALAGPAGVDSPLPPARGCVPARLVVGSSARSPARTFARSLHYLRSGVATIRARGVKGFDRPRQTWRSRWQPIPYESVATWRNGSRRGYMGV